mmetsp:Transcript_11767/g.24685  ORF Transcript_11767/g.24685 Transcript_11767/m.24685 type:complete len:216 (+) Transcript_11767:382-1029(+)
MCVINMHPVFALTIGRALPAPHGPAMGNPGSRPVPRVLTERSYGCHGQLGEDGNQNARAKDNGEKGCHGGGLDLGGVPPVASALYVLLQPECDEQQKGYWLHVLDVHSECSPEQALVGVQAMSQLPDKVIHASHHHCIPPLILHPGLHRPSRLFPCALLPGSYTCRWVSARAHGRPLTRSAEIERPRSDEATARHPEERRHGCRAGARAGAPPHQ